MTKTAAERQREYRARNPDKVAAQRARAKERQRERRNSRQLTDHLCECGCGEYTLTSTYTDTRRGMKVGEPLHYKHGHNPVYRSGERIEQRYCEEDRGYNSPCWIWLLKVTREGYGQERDRPAHRNYYERFVGQIPAGYVVDHLCQVKSCVNPDHLEAITPQENVWRAFMTRAGLTTSQKLSLREWMKVNLTADQLAILWSGYTWMNSGSQI